MKTMYGLKIYTPEEIQNLEDGKNVVRVFAMAGNLRNLTAYDINSTELKKGGTGYEFVMESG